MGLEGIAQHIGQFTYQALKLPCRMVMLQRRHTAILYVSRMSCDLRPRPEVWCYLQGYTNKDGSLKTECGIHVAGDDEESGMSNIRK